MVVHSILFSPSRESLPPRSNSLSSSSLADHVTLFVSPLLARPTGMRSFENVSSPQEDLSNSSRSLNLERLRYSLPKQLPLPSVCRYLLLHIFFPNLHRLHRVASFCFDLCTNVAFHFFLHLHTHGLLYNTNDMVYPTLLSLSPSFFNLKQGAVGREPSTTPLSATPSFPSNSFLPSSLP